MTQRKEIRSKIRNVVTKLKELDEALLELSKTDVEIGKIFLPDFLKMAAKIHAISLDYLPKASVINIDTARKKDNNED